MRNPHEEAKNWMIMLLVWIDILLAAAAIVKIIK